MEIVLIIIYLILLFSCNEAEKSTTVRAPSHHLDSQAVPTTSKSTNKHSSSNSHNHKHGISKKRFHHHSTEALNKLFCEDVENWKVFPWRQSWHWRHCPYAHEKYEESLGHKIVPGSKIIPIFVIFHDEVTLLKEFLRSLHESVEASFQVIVIETFSIVPEAVSFVEWLREHHIPVLYGSRLSTMEEMGKLGSLIDAYMEEHPEYEQYVVTDSNISLQGVHRSILQIYSTLLKNFPAASSVRSLIKVDEFPNRHHDKDLNEEMSLVRNADIKAIAIADQNINYFTTTANYSFSMYRRGFSWNYNSESINVLSPFQIRRSDWYLHNTTTDLPIDLQIYNCFKSTGSTSKELPDCSLIISKGNLSLEVGQYQQQDLRRSIFNHDRIHRIIGDVPIFVKVGSAKSHDYMRFNRKKNHGLHVNQSSLSSKSTVHSNNQHKFWVEINSQFESMLITEHHMILPFFAVPTNKNIGADIFLQDIYYNRINPDCHSLFASNYSQTDVLVFQQEYATNCQHIEAEYGKDKLFYHDEKITAEESVAKYSKVSFDCIASKNSVLMKRNAASLSVIIDELKQYNIQLLDIESKGADSALLYSISDQLKYIKRIRCECHRSTGERKSYWRSGDSDNDCDRISEYLRKHEFQVDYVRVKNCGLSEFRLQASKKPSLAAGALMTMMHHGSSSQNTGLAHQGSVLPHYMVVFVVRISASAWSEFEHFLKPSIEAFVNKRQFQILLLLDPLSNGETGAGTDTTHIHHLEQHHYQVKHLSAEHFVHDDWIYFIDHYVESTIDVIGILGVKDIFHTFVTMSNLIDEEGKLVNVAVYSPQAINSKAHHSIPKLDDQYDIMTVSHAPKLFYRSTFEHLRQFLVKQYRVESLQEIWTTRIQTMTWPIFNIVFNYALQFENEKYKVILPQDSTGVLSIANGDQNIDKKFGCCHVFAIYAGKDCVFENEEEAYKQESKALLPILLLNGTVISPKYEDKWNLVQEHYQVVKMQLKKMNRYHIKRMSQLCSKN